MINIFDYTDYKAFLRDKETELSVFQRGFRSRLAEVLNCQNAYISQILNTHANFSLEQSYKLGQFLKFNESENRYFLLLIEVARAGTEELKNYFKKDIESMRLKHLNIKDRIESAKSLSIENQNTYYSSWVYPTIHMMITIPQYRTLNKISEALKISEEVTAEAMMFLVGAGLAIEKNGLFKPEATQIHLAKDSTLIQQHHTNWRIRAINSLTDKHKSEIHYSTVSSLSLEDAEKLKSKFVQVIQDYVKTVEPSKEETIYNFNLDFYSLIKK